jgi:hypothetical protein
VPHPDDYREPLTSFGYTASPLAFREACCESERSDWFTEESPNCTLECPCVALPLVELCRARALVANGDRCVRKHMIGHLPQRQYYSDPSVPSGHLPLQGRIMGEDRSLITVNRRDLFFQRKGEKPCFCLRNCVARQSPLSKRTKQRGASRVTVMCSVKF